MDQTLGARTADRLTGFIGSWKFVIGQAVFLIAWFLVNSLTILGFLAWDEYPFILANLFMSAEAAFAAPIIMMSQNRAANADRRTLIKDLEADIEALEILRDLKNVIIEKTKGSG